MNARVDLKTRRAHFWELLLLLLQPPLPRRT